MNYSPLLRQSQDKLCIAHRRAAPRYLPEGDKLFGFHANLALACALAARSAARTTLANLSGRDDARDKQGMQSAEVRKSLRPNRWARS